MGRLDSWLFGALLSTLLPPAMLLASLAAAYCGWRAVTEAGGQTASDLTRHRYVLGRQGSGKSMCCVKMYQEGLSMGHACVWVSTHGSQVLPYIPPKYPVVYFHPTQGLGINLLRQYTHTRFEKAVIASQCVTVFKRLFPRSLGDNMELLAEAGALALLEAAGRTKTEASLMDLYHLLQQDDVDTINPIAAQVLSEREKRTKDATVRRLAKPLLNDILRGAFSAKGKEAIDLSILLDPPGPMAIVFDIDKHTIGKENADLLAHIVTSHLEVVLSSRSGHERMVEVYCDECQTYAHDGLAEAVEEGRKRNVCWTFAHQNRSQTPDRLKDALALCGSQYFFRVLPQDANYASQTLNKKLYPPERLIALPERRYVATELIRGRSRITAARTPYLKRLREAFPKRDDAEPAPAPEVATDGILRRGISE